VDLTEENVHVIAQDKTQLFPVQGDWEWLWEKIEIGIGKRLC
jgi:hypothetical protein